MMGKDRMYCKLDNYKKIDFRFAIALYVLSAFIKAICTKN